MRPNLSGPEAEDEDEFPEPPRLRVLRLTVMGLMVTLAVGMAVIVGTITWRLFSVSPPPEPIRAETLALPQDHEITALGASAREVLVTLRAPDGAERLLVFRRSTGELLSDTPIRRP